jgi:hypothetical protein
VTVKNTSGGALPLRLFMFSDFDMNGTVDFDSISITGGNTATQTDGLSLIESQVVATPIPFRVQAGDRDDLLLLLNNITPTTLDNTTTYSGPDDPAWALQWNANVPVGASFIISNSQSVQSAFVVPVGLIGFARRFQRARRHAS